MSDYTKSLAQEETAISGKVMRPSGEFRHQISAEEYVSHAREKYQDMISRMRELADVYGSEIRVVLAGQRIDVGYDGKNADALAFRMIEREEVVSDLVAAGVQRSNIEDMRSNEWSKDRGDHVLYDPKTKKILINRS
jgi:hypothetical protein